MDSQRKSEGRYSFFRSGYITEVNNVIRIITTEWVSLGALIILWRKHPERTKQVLQHIYTFDKAYFDKLKASFHIHNTKPTDSNPEENMYTQFLSEIKDEIKNIVTSTKPEFGYCTDCKEFLDKHQKKKYPNLKDVNDSFLDWTKW